MTILGPVAKASLDYIAIMIALGAILEYLPPIAAVLSVIAAAFSIYEGRTVQCWLYPHKRKCREDDNEEG